MKKDKNQCILLLILAVILTINSLVICWNSFISQRTTSVIYTSLGGKQIALKYDHKNNPQVFFIHNEIIGYSENNTEFESIEYKSIYNYNGKYFIIPPKLKINWISENEIQLIGTDFLSRSISETIFLN